MGLETAFEIGQASLQIKRIADILSASQKDVFVRLPGLMAYWPMGIRLSSGAVAEHAGPGNSLLQTGICPTGYDGNSFAHLGDGTNYLYASGGFGVTGLETWVSSSLRGLTVGGWFMIDSQPANQAGLITKWGAVTQYGYGMNVNSAGAIIAQISGNGSNFFAASSAAVATGQWAFFVARFIPSTEVAVFVNGNKTTNTTAIPVSANVSTQNLEVGRSTADDNFIAHAKARDVFICAAALSDALIEEIRVTSTP